MLVAGIQYYRGAGVVARAGNVTITRGEFDVTGDTTGMIFDSRVVVSYSAIVFDSAARLLCEGRNSKINVTGGIFTSEVDPITILPADESVPEPGRVINNGGNFTVIRAD